MLAIREEYQDKDTVVYNIGLNINQGEKSLYTEDGIILILKYKANIVGKNLIIELYDINQTYFEQGDCYFTSSMWITTTMSTTLYDNNGNYVNSWGR